MKDIKIFACNSAEEFTKNICEYLGIQMGQRDSFKFANDNSFVQLKESVRGKDVYIVQTTQPPVNERIMELLMFVETAKRAGAKKVTAVLPYFMYSRSDKKDQSRVPVTAKLMANILEASGVDHVLTCDLHNPAIQAYFNILCDRVTGKYLLQEYFKDIINVDYTKEMEDDLDKIADGNMVWTKLLDKFYQEFEPKVNAAFTNMAKKPAEETGESCPNCNSPLVIKRSKYGEFIACSNYPQCKYIKSNKE